jgi:catechol 2,3-dioxygenase-like lactoylglutathione lyase family enzyme
MRIVLILAGLASGSVGCSDKREHVDPLAAAAKACGDDGELECPRPILTVSNLRAAQGYYRDALGFKIDWEHGEPADFGSVSRSNLILFMCQQCQGHPDAWVFTFAHDVDKLHREFVERHAKIRMPPTNMAWGLREMHVEDPDGNVLRFAGPIEH